MYRWVSPQFTCTRCSGWHGRRSHGDREQPHPPVWAPAPRPGSIRRNGRRCRRASLPRQNSTFIRGLLAGGADRLPGRRGGLHRQQRPRGDAQSRPGCRVLTATPADCARTLDQIAALQTVAEESPGCGDALRMERWRPPRSRGQRQGGAGGRRTKQFGSAPSRSNVACLTVHTLTEPAPARPERADVPFRSGEIVVLDCSNRKKTSDQNPRIGRRGDR
jgi:hypothetical protein